MCNENKIFYLQDTLLVVMEVVDITSVLFVPCYVNLCIKRYKDMHLCCSQFYPFFIS